MAAKRILIVEDSKDLAEGLKKHLESFGFEVLLAHDGDAGLETAFAEIPNLILLDLMLPKTDGYTICKTLKQSKKCKNVPIIFLSGRAHEEEKILGLSYGADDYVTKPFDFADLLSRIKRLIK